VITICDFDCDKSQLIKWKIGTHFNDDTSPVLFYLPQCVSQFKQAKFANGGLILSLSQFLLLPELHTMGQNARFGALIDYLVILFS
jgi:hypothetical protein